MKQNAMAGRIRAGTIVQDEFGESNSNLERDYRIEQERLANIVRILNEQQQDAYNRAQAALPFNERELPFTDADVLRLGGTEPNESEIDINEEDVDTNRIDNESLH